MRVVLVAFLLTPLAGGALTDTASVGGKWQLHQSIAGNESDQACTFTQDGADLTGSCNSDQASGNLTGKVADNKVSWTYKTTYNGGPVTLNYSGTLDTSHKMTGTVHVEEYSVDGEFTAMPAK